MKAKTIWKLLSAFLALALVVGVGIVLKTPAAAAPEKGDTADYSDLPTKEIYLWSEADIAKHSDYADYERDTSAAIGTYENPYTSLREIYGYYGLLSGAGVRTNDLSDDLTYYSSHDPDRTKKAKDYYAEEVPYQGGTAPVERIVIHVMGDTVSSSATQQFFFPYGTSYSTTSTSETGTVVWQVLTQKGRTHGTDETTDRLLFEFVGDPFEEDTTPTIYLRNSGANLIMDNDVTFENVTISQDTTDNWGGARTTAFQYMIVTADRFVVKDNVKFLGRAKASGPVTECFSICGSSEGINGGTPNAIRLKNGNLIPREGASGTTNGKRVLTASASATAATFQGMPILSSKTTALGTGVWEGDRLLRYTFQHGRTIELHSGKYLGIDVFGYARYTAGKNGETYNFVAENIETENLYFFREAFEAVPDENGKNPVFNARLLNGVKIVTHATQGDMSTEINYKAVHNGSGRLSLFSGLTVVSAWYYRNGENSWSAIAPDQNDRHFDMNMEIDIGDTGFIGNADTTGAGVRIGIFGREPFQVNGEPDSFSRSCAWHGDFNLDFKSGTVNVIRCLSGNINKLTTQSSSNNFNNDTYSLYDGKMTVNIYGGKVIGYVTPAEGTMPISADASFEMNVYGGEIGQDMEFAYNEGKSSANTDCPKGIVATGGLIKKSPGSENPIAVNVYGGSIWRITAVLPRAAYSNHGAEGLACENITVTVDAKKTAEVNGESVSCAPIVITDAISTAGGASYDLTSGSAKRTVSGTSGSAWPGLASDVNNVTFNIYGSLDGAPAPTIGAVNVSGAMVGSNNTSSWQPSEGLGVDLTNLTYNLGRDDESEVKPVITGNSSFGSFFATPNWDSDCARINGLTLNVYGAETKQGIVGAVASNDTVFIDNFEINLHDSNGKTYGDIMGTRLSGSATTPLDSIGKFTVNVYDGAVVNRIFGATNMGGLEEFAVNVEGGQVQYITGAYYNYGSSGGDKVDNDTGKHDAKLGKMTVTISGGTFTMPCVVYGLSARSMGEYNFAGANNFSSAHMTQYNKEHGRWNSKGSIEELNITITGGNYTHGREAYIVANGSAGGTVKEANIEINAPDATFAKPNNNSVVSGFTVFGVARPIATKTQAEADTTAFDTANSVSKVDELNLNVTNSQMGMIYGTYYRGCEIGALNITLGKGTVVNGYIRLGGYTSNRPVGEDPNIAEVRESTIKTANVLIDGAELTQYSYGAYFYGSSIDEFNMIFKSGLYAGVYASAGGHIDTARIFLLGGEVKQSTQTNMTAGSFGAELDEANGGGTAGDVDNAEFYVLGATEYDYRPDGERMIPVIYLGYGKIGTINDSTTFYTNGGTFGYTQIAEGTKIGTTDKAAQVKVIFANETKEVAVKYTDAAGQEQTFFTESIAPSEIKLRFTSEGTGHIAFDLRAPVAGTNNYTTTTTFQEGAVLNIQSTESENNALFLFNGEIEGEARIVIDEDPSLRSLEYVGYSSPGTKVIVTDKDGVLYVPQETTVREGTALGYNPMKLFTGNTIIYNSTFDGRFLLSKASMEAFLTVYEGGEVEITVAYNGESVTKKLSDMEAVGDFYEFLVTGIAPKAIDTEVVLTVKVTLKGEKYTIDAWTTSILDSLQRAYNQTDWEVADPAMKAAAQATLEYCQAAADVFRPGDEVEYWTETGIEDKTYSEVEQYSSGSGAVTIKGTSIVLNSELAIKFYADPGSYGGDLNDVKVFINGTDKTSEVKKEVNAGSAHYWSFKIAVPISEMPNEMTITLQDAGGQTISNTYTDSIVSYAAGTLNPAYGMSEQDQKIGQAVMNYVWYVNEHLAGLD